MLETAKKRIIKERVAYGESYHAVANEFGVNPTTVKYWTDSSYREHRKERMRSHYGSNSAYREAALQRAKESSQSFFARFPQGSEQRVRRQLAALNAVQRQRRQKEIPQTSEQIAAAYTGRCEICGRDGVDCKQGRLNIDHNHDTGDFRGWLCGKCNSAIGYLSDNPVFLRKAAAYLEKTHAQET